MDKLEHLKHKNMAKKSLAMRIGELSKASLIPVETIRYFEKEGLLPEPERAPNNYRIYRQHHLERLLLIRNCRAFDMSHAEIHQLIDAAQKKEGCRPINELISEHLLHIDARIEELKALKTQLAKIHERCEQNHEADECTILEDLNQLEPRKWVPNTHLS